MASYFVTLCVLLVLGVYMGWPKHGKGGNGGGGRGKAPAPDPPPPGGSKVDPEGDFAAWEEQLRSRDIEPASDRPEDARYGT